MIITYVAPNGAPLLTRPQTAPPGLGHRVIVANDTHPPRMYRVAGIEWTVQDGAPPQAYFSMTDEALVEVRVLLREETL
jgi:hypothetical protein